ncbi:MAG: transglutaminase family protein [Armatimonadota bacterium]
MLRRCFASVLVLALCVFAQAVPDQTVWVSMKLQDSHVGYSQFRVFTKDGVVYKYSHEVFKTKLLGQPLSIDVETTSQMDAADQIRTTESVINSGGRRVKVMAVRKGSDFVATVEGESKPVKLPIPPDSNLHEDPSFDFFTGHQPPKKFVVFDPQNLTLVPNTVRSEGSAMVDTVAGKVKADVIVVEDSRSPTKYFVGPKGDVIQAVGPFGITMEPSTQAECEAGLDGESDIGNVASIPVGDLDETLRDAKKTVWQIEGSKIKISSDEHQSVADDGSGQELTVHPVTSPDRKVSIEHAKKGMEEWLEPEPRLPCDDPAMKAVAKKMVAGEKNLWKAAQNIRSGVHEALAVNAGIGVLRDAREVWSSKEGVCRDHAVLMATLLRASNIPTRLVSGLVYYSGALYYHAWVEVWDGKNWLGLDSTRPQEFLSPGHIKTAVGHLAEATNAFLLPGPKFVLKRGGE